MRLCGLEAGRGALLLRQRVPPADGRVGVVGARVHDLVHAVVPRCVRVAAPTAERPVQHDHAGEAELVAQRVDRRRDHAEVLRDELQVAELALQCREQLSSGGAAPAAALRSLVLLGNGPVRHEAAEVVDPREVDELEDTAEPLHPPAVAACAM